MKTNRTELVFILDRSGSMSGLESDTIGGFNSMLAKQKAEPGECRITTVLFDHEYEVLHDRIDLKAVEPIGRDEYFVRGNTALLDAVGTTINKIGGVQKNTAKDFQADKVLFVITTDGHENASREFAYDAVKDMITHQSEKYAWEFIFLGANIDVAKEGRKMGIRADRSYAFDATRDGIKRMYRESAVACYALRLPRQGVQDDS